MKQKWSNLFDESLIDLFIRFIFNILNDFGMHGCMLETSHVAQQPEKETLRALIDKKKIKKDEEISCEIVPLKN